ncbi:response regulator transcription factor [Williamsia sp. CHRR-6]|uniref:response regulator n=1 Tax=Williamsia sp. CHRR-6 TaxID=2835871 RepID=UPI001BDA8B0C|nr:response regulator transcription factor [Williamsia sp. CHRR-6]MBT0565646.1 response regulator transcription factor [Williamsia sp. CHRR-6]
MTSDTAVVEPRRAERFSVLIADDDPFVHRGLTAILEAAGDLTVVACVDDGDQVLDAVDRHRPHVLLVDLVMKRVGGVAAITAVLNRPDPPRVIAMTALDVDGLVADAIRAGAHSFLRKVEPPHTFALAVTAVAAGTTVFSEQCLRMLVAVQSPTKAAADARSATLVNALTTREREVLAEVARGQATAVIARALHLGETTVKAHLQSIYTKFGSANRVDAAVHAVRAGLID